MEGDDRADNELGNELMTVLLGLRADAKAKKDYATGDLIRDRLDAIGIKVKDTKEGVTWERN